jgi:hypothetical protein
VSYTTGASRSTTHIIELQNVTTIIFSDSNRRFQSSRNDKRLALLSYVSLISQLISTEVIAISFAVDRTLLRMSTIITRYKINSQNKYIQTIEPDVVIYEYLVITVYKSATIPLNVIERTKETEDMRI